MLLKHLDLLFNQHLSRLVSCCVYGTTRMHNVVVSIKVTLLLPALHCLNELSQ